MVFQRNVTLRVLIWIFVIAVGQFPMICEAQTADKNRDEIHNIDQRLSAVEKALADLQTALGAERGQKFDQRVSALEKAGAASQANSNITDEQRAYLNRVDSLRAKFDGIEGRMAQTAERLAGTEMSISYNYFTIFSLLVALAGVVGTLAALIIKRVVLDAVTEDVKKQIEKSVEQEEKEMKIIARFETDLAMADTLFKMSFAWWEQYQEAFRKLLMQRKTVTEAELPEPAALELRMARILSERGKTIVSTNSFSGLNPDDNRPWIMRTRLLNLWVYNTTAELLCLRVTTSPEKKYEILRAADLLIELAQDKRSQKKADGSPEAFWYKLYETAAFAMTHLGNEGTQERGRTLMRDLCARKTPGDGFERPSDKWIAQLRSEKEIDG